jgi:hypothetical protein
MTTINPHTTRGTGTILTAAIYNADHNNHVTNAQNLNSDKLERSGGVTPGNLAVWVDDDFLEDGGAAGSAANVNIGTSGATVPLLNGNNTHSGNDTFTGAFTLESSSADALEGPTLSLRRNSASPADNDLLAAISAIGRNSTPADIVYAKILAMLVDEGAGSEGGEWQFHTMVAGTLTQRMRLRQGLRLGSPTGGDLGEGTLNATELYKNGVASWTTRVQASDQTNTTTTLANITDIAFAMLAGTNYAFRAHVYYDTPTAADFKWRHTGPASPTLVSIARENLTPDGTGWVCATDEAYSAADITMLGAAGTFGMFRCEGIIRNGVNAGDFQLQFAQNAASGTTTLRAGSYIEYRQL